MSVAVQLVNRAKGPDSARTFDTSATGGGVIRSGAPRYTPSSALDQPRASEWARQYLQNRLNIESHQIADFYEQWSKSFACAAPCVLEITMSESDIYWEEPPAIRDGKVVRYMRKSFDCVVDCVPAG